jgi:hypothetical protein
VERAPGIAVLVVAQLHSRMRYLGEDISFDLCLQHQSQLVYAHYISGQEFLYQKTFVDSFAIRHHIRVPQPPSLLHWYHSKSARQQQLSPPVNNLFSAQLACIPRLA